MTKIVNQDQFNQSMEAKGNMCYNEKKRLLFFGLPWTFTRYELRENVITTLTGFFTVHENDCYMYKISDVEITRSLMQRMFGLSTITMYTSDVTDRTIIMKNIKHGREIKDFLLQASESARLRRRTVSMQNIGFGASDVHDMDEFDGID